MLLQAFRTNQARLGDRLIGALMVAFHPDLIAGSVAGLEIPLAALLACVLLYTARASGVLGYALACAVAPLARPELTLLCYTIPLLLFANANRRRVWPLLAGALVGNGASFGLMALRNLLVSGLPLPATFYAKVGRELMTVPARRVTGFAGVLRQFAITDSSVLLAAVLVFSAAVVVTTKTTDEQSSIAASAFLSGIVYCAVSFVLVPAARPRGFVSPALRAPGAAAARRRRPALGARRRAPVVADSSGHRCLWRAAGADRRQPHDRSVDAVPVLGNDAQNIDEVQVAAGQALASAPASEITWAIDAGAIRYFGNTFVVDLMGLNNAQLLGADAQKFLDEHRPRYIEFVPSWSHLDAQSARAMRGVLFEPTTPYTVTSIRPMRRHWLALCEPGMSGQLWVRTRAFDFACAP